MACESCKHLDRTVSYPYICVRYPPVVFSLRDRSGRLDWISKWPEIHLHDTCGEFKELEEKGD